MARSLRRLTRPEILREIHPERLLRLLSGHDAYFREQEFALPESPEDLDIERLARILQDAARQAPPDLIDALFLIDQLATTAGVDAVRGTATTLGVTLPQGEERSAADIALEAWLAEPAVLTRAEASRLSVRSRTLRIFVCSSDVDLIGANGRHEVADVVTYAAAPGTVDRVKGILNQQLTLDGRGAVVDVVPFASEVGVAYVVQRGGVFERHGAIVKGKRTSIGYEPLAFDIVVLDAVHRELQLKRDPPGEQTALRSALALVLTGDAGAFNQPATIDLEPIHRGRTCLWTRDVPGLKSARLTGAMMRIQPALDHVREERATDLYQAWEQRGHGVPSGTVVKVQIEFEFEDSKAPRCVTLTSGATVRLTRDDDGELVNRWMRQRSFVVGSGVAPPSATDFWGWLEKPDDVLATDADWQERLGAEYEAARVHFADAAAIMPKVLLAGEEAEVLPDGQGGFQAVSKLTGQMQDVDPVALSLRQLEVGSVSKAVAHAMRLRGAVAPVENCPGAWWIGRYTARGDETWQVCFVAAADPASLRSACLTLWGIYKGPFILVTPTRSHGTPDLADAIGVVSRGWIALSECATLDGVGAIVITGDLQTRLMPFLQVVMPDAFGASSRPQFPTPPDAKWSDVRIKFLDPHRVSVTVGDQTHQYSYQGMGMADKRNQQPTDQWELIRAFAEGNRELTWESRHASAKQRQAKTRLSAQLRAFFGIESDPIEYIKKAKGWRTRFLVEPDWPQ